MDQHEPIPPDQVTFTAAEIAGIKEALADFEERGGVAIEESMRGWTLESLTTRFRNRSRASSDKH